MRIRPAQAGPGSATPKVPGFLASRVEPAGLSSLVRGIRTGQVDYPLAELDRSNPAWCWMTFIWRENDPAHPASAVILSANSMVDHERPAESEYEQVADGLWAITLRVPSDWVASYRLTVHRGGGPAPWRSAADRREIRLAADAGGIDELNPRVGAGMNGTPVSLVKGPAARPSRHLAAACPDLTRSGPAIGGFGQPARDTTALPERVEHHRLHDQNCSRLRSLWTYRPPLPVTDTPLLVVHDGATWVRFQSIAASLDRAIAAGQLPAVHALFIDSASVPTRSSELPVAHGTTRSLVTQFLPWARRLLPVTSEPQGTVVTGASFGGLAALLTVIHHPDQVGIALAQSPSLWHTDLTGQLGQVDPRCRILIQSGRYEPGIFNACKELMHGLEKAEPAPRIDFQPVSGGHDWAWWVPEMISGLARLLGSAPGSPQPARNEVPDGTASS